jgi:hypothetical protein
MKPEGNRVGIWTGRTVRPQRTIGYEENVNSNPNIALPTQPDFKQPQILK